MSGFLVPALPEYQLAPQSRTFEGPVKIAVGHCSVKKEMEERPSEMQVVDMSGLPHIPPLVEEEQKKEGSSASFSEIKLDSKVFRE